MTTPVSATRAEIDRVVEGYVAKADDLRWPLPDFLR
jgi:hypothetical protein